MNPRGNERIGQSPARRSGRRLAGAGVLALALMTGWPAQASFDRFEKVRLRLLDKVTARTSTVDVAVGATYRFATLEITVRTCRQRPPEERPESAAFLEIAEAGASVAAPEPLYSGWMFASSPAVAALEHPVYDVWVLSCAGKKGAQRPVPLPPPQARPS